MSVSGWSGPVWAVGVALAVAGTAGAEEQCLAIQKSVVRDAPRYVGKVVSEIKRPARLTIETREAGWARVTVEGKRGWVHQGILADCPAGGGGTAPAAAGERREGGGAVANPLNSLFGGLSLGGGSSTGGEQAEGYSKEEITLAGKGFDERGEQALAGQGKYDFAAVDWLAKRAVSERAVAAFAAKGKLVARAYRAPREPNLVDDAAEGVGDVLNDLGGLFK